MFQVIKQTYPTSVASLSVKDKEMQRKKELARKPGEPPVEKNEGSKFSTTWRPLNDYVNLKVKKLFSSN